MFKSQSRLILVTFIVLLTLYLMTLNVRGPDVTLILEEATEPQPHVIAVQYDDAEKQTAHDLTTSQAIDILKPEYGANTVFSVWCGKRWFEFAHFVSIRSALRHIRPDSFTFLYQNDPVQDYWLYNTWLKELKHEYPFFVMEKLTDNVKACGSDGRVRLQYIYERLARPGGGVFVEERTVFDRYPMSLRGKSVVNGWNVDTTSGFISSNGHIRNAKDLKVACEEQAIETENICADRTSFEVVSNDLFSTTSQLEMSTTPICYHLDPAVQSIYPKDIWTRDSNIGRSIRNIMYDSSNIVSQRISDEDLVPNIAHVVWLGGGPMDFLFYLCVLSLVYVAEVDTVYVHGDSPPTGEYWKYISSLPQVKQIYRENPGSVYGTEVKVISHVTDIWRVDFMIKYGGIYIDTDAVFVQKLTKEMRSYDAMGSYDWTYWNAPFPDTINFGVMLGKKGAPYWTYFQESMRWFIDEDWAWNGLRQPYKIQERHPDLVRIDPHLQTICYLELCHPTWWQGYHDENQTHVNPMRKERSFNWRKDTYAMHWTLPTPSELTSKDKLLASNSQFAEIGKFILDKAGLL